MIETSIQVGDPAAYRGVVITPLFPRRTPVAHYLTLGEALPLGLRVTEIDTDGSVPELGGGESACYRRLALRRRGTGRRKAEPDPQRDRAREREECDPDPGLLRRGGSMGRSVRCVFRGDAHSAHRPYGRVRRRPSSRSRSPVVSPRARSGMPSPPRWPPTASTRPPRPSPMCFTPESSAWATSVPRFPLVPGQSGAVLAVGTEAVCLDWVSRPEAFVRLYPKLLDGYLLDALERLDQAPAPVEEIGRFTSALAMAAVTRRPSAGRGTDLRVRGVGCRGSGLELDGELLQLSAFIVPGLKSAESHRRR